MRMLYKQRTLSLCIGMLFYTFVNTILELQSIESKNIMSTQKEQHSQADWLKYIQETAKDSGSFLAKDKIGVPVILEWQKTNLLKPEFATAMKGIAEIGVAAFESVEMEFLYKYPEVVSKDNFFKSFEPLFKNGVEVVNWSAVSEQMRSTLQGHFIFDSTKFSKEMASMFANDICFFVAIKDQAAKTMLGYITFLLKPEYSYGNCKVTGMAVIPTAQNRGLAKLLMSSIFKIAPDLKRIFLCTRVTNTTALRAYSSWGFTKDLDPVQDPHYKFNLEHWTFMEYKQEQSDILQKTAEFLIS